MKLEKNPLLQLLKEKNTIYFNFANNLVQGLNKYKIKEREVSKHNSKLKKLNNSKLKKLNNKDTLIIKELKRSLRNPLNHLNELTRVYYFDNGGNEFTESEATRINKKLYGSFQMDYCDAEISSNERFLQGYTIANGSIDEICLIKEDFEPQILERLSYLRELILVECFENFEDISVFKKLIDRGTHIIHLDENLC